MESSELLSDCPQAGLKPPPPPAPRSLPDHREKWVEALLKLILYKLTLAFA